MQYNHISFLISGKSILQHFTCNLHYSSKQQQKVLLLFIMSYRGGSSFSKPGKETIQSNSSWEFSKILFPALGQLYGHNKIL